MKEFSTADEIESLRAKIEELSERESEHSVRLEQAECTSKLQNKTIKRKTLIIYRLKRKMRKWKSERIVNRWNEKELSCLPTNVTDKNFYDIVGKSCDIHQSYLHYLKLTLNFWYWSNWFNHLIITLTDLKIQAIFLC